MRSFAAWLLLPIAAFAQSDSKTPSPEAEQALRARVNEFFQYHVDGKFSKAYEMVAEDTKEYYFATQKVQFKSFKIDSIKFIDDTHAEVDLTGQRIWKPRYDFPETVVAVPMHTKWKIEDGKWVWYEDQRSRWATPMGPSDPSVARSGGAQNAPDLSPEALRRRAQEILKQQQQQPVLDKTELVLPLDKASSEQIVFHNNEGGTIKIYLDPTAKMPGLTAELDKSDVPAGETATIKVRFDPKEAPQPPASFTLRLIAEPFDRVLPITIKFGAPPAAQ